MLANPSAGPAVGQNPLQGLLDRLRPGGFQPWSIWVRDDRGPAIPLRIVGVLDPRVTVGAGIYTSTRSLEGAHWAAPRQAAYYPKAGEGVRPLNLALGLNFSFDDRGLQATAIGEETRRLHTVRSLLNGLLQGFFAIGLLAGLAALGVLGLRAVLERRQQLGLLRALGMPGRTVQLTLLLEASIVAALGSVLGIALGLAMAARLVEHFARQNPELLFSVPVEQIGGIALLAWLASLGMTALPARQAGQVPPAAALRS